jgi:hypothetical protein
MGWRVATTHAEISKNTVLSIYRQPWVVGRRAERFPIGAQLRGQLADNTPFSLDVIELDNDEAVVLAVGAAWRMKRVEPNQLTVPPAPTGGAPATYWVIIDRVP